ncbi:MAG: hypothetical protein ACKVQU_33265 [Burkholderiales bacterium]
MDRSIIRTGSGCTMTPPDKIDDAPGHAQSGRRLSYRVIVHDIRPGFDRTAVLQGVAHLFPRDRIRPSHEHNDMPECPPIARRMRYASEATRLADLLTQAGCRCSIEIGVEAPPRAETRSGAQATHGSWYRGIVADIRGAAVGPLRIIASRMARFWTPGIQQFVFALGALATIGVLSSAIPGYSVPAGRSDTGAQPSRRDNRPLAPVIELHQAMRASGMGARRGVELPAAGLHHAATSLGAISLERVPLNPNLWALKWNDSTLRELHVESTPSIVSRHGGNRLEAAIGEFGDEVALVIDTGEPRSLFCQANKTLLVVLSKVGAAHLHDIPGNCVELESVAVDERKLLMHFYDRAAPSVAYEAGQILRIGR